MRKKLYNYIKYLEENLSKKQTIEKEAVLTEISFYQHERLVHLLVTILTGISTILFFVGFLILENISLLILFLITILLFIPYIIHYYYLENGVQKLYDLYRKIPSKK